MCQDCCSAKGQRYWGLLVAAISITAFALAIYLPGAIDHALNTAIDDLVTVDAKAQADSKDNYKAWVNPLDENATPIYYSVYLWNLINAVNVIVAAAPPQVEQKGPYVYRKLQFKNNAVFSKDPLGRDICSYQPRYYYEFQPSMSTGSESDIITNVNVPFAALRGPAIGTLYSLYPNDPSRFLTSRNVTEWLWGYYDPVIAAASGGKNFPGLLGPNEGITNPLAPTDVVYVGTAPDQTLVRQFTRYQNLDYLTKTIFTPPATFNVLPVWANPRANRISGTDGTLFARGIQDGQSISVYVTQIVRTVPLLNVNNAHITLKGLDLVRFTIPRVFLQNCTNNPFNCDYYMNGFNGLMNLTATSQQRPDFYVSKPHFLDADAEVRAQVTGVSPNADLHDTFIDVEPISGLTMRAAKRLQLNIRLQPITAILPGGNTTVWGAGLPFQSTGVYIPVYWAEEKGEVQDSAADKFRMGVYGAQRASFGIKTAGFIIGIVFAIATCVLMARASMVAEAPKNTS